MKKIYLALLLLIGVSITKAENGHSLWLRMAKNDVPATVKTVGAKKSVVVATAANELKQYWKGGQVILSLAGNSSDDTYTIGNDNNVITVTSSTENGLLYGAYALLRMQQTGEPVRTLSDSPTSNLRILNHWDNPNGTVERGFSGKSIFWKEGGMADLEIVKEYGRACASIGINATVLNNVNAKALMLDTKKLAETKRIADALRPYGIRVFLSINFATPKVIGGLETADPLDKKVIAWWNKKCIEIYKTIPDFGGFLVKANSEGEPGPMDYGRNHADGANMLANALNVGYGSTKHSANTPKPIVMWRAFVYSPKGTDRASQAYDEFMPLDGKFRENVIIQVKNGPIDFQPREPVSPLFFSLEKTPVMPEFQITQEYTGQSVHTCFLASMWKEFFDTVKGFARIKKYDAVAGVANVGDMKDWCGSDMTQVNWYAFGRMAWNDAITPQQIADEWLKQTYTTDKAFVEPMTDVLMESREAVVRYMMPLGLHHIFAGGHHYGPEPWCDPQGWREDWKPKYYHKADKAGIGFDRTMAGSQNVRQYPDALFNIYNNVETCPEQFLLWFHHVPWTHKMHNGETMWEALCHTYDQGVRQAEAFARIWEQMKPYVDAERYEAQKLNFDRQAKDAWWWRDACLLYFQQFSGMKLPLDCPAPKYKFEDLQKYKLPIDNYTRAPFEKLP